MRLLFDNKLAPVTSTVGFIEARATEIADAFIAWMSPIQSKRGVTIKSRPVVGSLEEALDQLLPLTNVERRRYLFVPTTSRWTAFFDNGVRGTDAFSTLSFLARSTSVRAGSFTAVPDQDIYRQGRTRRYGASILELYSPEDKEFLNYERSISLANEGGGKWEFHAAGTIQPFEEEEFYRKRRVEDRFPLELLSRYLKALEFDGFSEDFYQLTSDQPGVLVEKVGPLAPGVKEYSIQEALTV
jgi:hypothetical protein